MVPPLVVTAIFPLVAPVGTVVVIFESDFTANVVEVPLNVTLVACVSPVPVIVTGVPTGPLVGEKALIVGLTLYVDVVDNVVEPVVTVTLPVSAAAGTVANRKVLPVWVTVVAFTPPNLTTEAMLK